MGKNKTRRPGRLYKHLVTIIFSMRETLWVLPMQKDYPRFDFVLTKVN